jgi:hypothetical protein
MPAQLLLLADLLYNLACDSFHIQAKCTRNNTNIVVKLANFAGEQDRRDHYHWERKTLLIPCKTVLNLKQEGSLRYSRLDSSNVVQITGLIASYTMLSLHNTVQ